MGVAEQEEERVGDCGRQRGTGKTRGTKETMGVAEQEWETVGDSEGLGRLEGPRRPWDECIGRGNMDRPRNCSNELTTGM